MPRRSTSPTRINLPDNHWLDCREANNPGTYYIYWREPDGKRRKESTGETRSDEALAYYFGAFSEQRQLDLKRSAAPKGDPLWADLLDWYEGEKRREKKSPSLFDNCKLLRRATQGLRVSETDGAFWEQYKVDRRAGAYSLYRVKHPDWKDGVRASEETLLRELRCMRTVLRTGMAAQRVSPALMPQFRMPKDPGPRRDRLDAQQMADCLAKALALSPPEDKGPLRRITLVVFLALCTGGRIRSLELLTWDRVRWQENEIDLKAPGHNETGKKNAAVVPILPALRPVLERAYRERISEWVLSSCAPTWSIWTQFRDTHFPGLRLRRHDLRRSIATKLAQDDATLAQIAAFLGNTQSVTERVYLQPDKSVLAKSVLAHVKRF